MVGAVKGLFGLKTDKKLTRFTPPGFASPAGSATFDPGTNSFVFTPQTSGAVNTLTNRLLERTAALRELRPQLRPGFGRLTEARVQAIQGARGRSIGNLREELAKRRILGSSFAQIETQRQEAAFAQQEAEARATSFLQELDATTRLIGEEFASSVAAAEAVLNQFNFETSVAAGLGTAAGEALSANARAIGAIKQASDTETLEVISDAIGFARTLFLGGAE